MHIRYRLKSYMLVLVRLINLFPTEILVHSVARDSESTIQYVCGDKIHSRSISTALLIMREFF